MSIKTYATTKRKRDLEKDGHFYYSECLSCNLNCERLSGREGETFSLSTCPKKDKEVYTNGKKRRRTS